MRSLTLWLVGALTWGVGAAPLPEQVNLRLETFPASEVYLDTSQGESFLGLSGQNLPVAPPTLRDARGEPVEYTAGVLVLRAKNHQAYRLNVGAQDWLKGRLPPSGQIQLIPSNNWVWLQDLVQLHPWLWLAGGLGLATLAWGAVRWRRLARTRGAEVKRLGSRLQTTGDPLLGKTLGERYLVEARLGQGGMGAVYRVSNLEGALFAAKVLYFDSFEDLNLGRFRREFRVITQLNHPNLVRAFDYGEEEGVAYYIMEYIQGRTLDHYIRPEGLSWTQVWPWMETILGALEAAHRCGVVHRDLKPGNIIMLPDTLKILDFGLARHADITALTMTGQAMGTPSYMAPEQVSASSHQVDPRADLYSVGVILFQLLSGRLPFECDSPQKMIHEKRTKAAPRLSTLVPTIPRELEVAVGVLLERRPENRYQDAQRALEVLRECAPGASGAASSVEMARPGGKDTLSLGDLS